MCRLDVYLGYVVYFESVRFSHFSDLSFFPLFLCTKSIFIWEILHLQYNFLAFYAHLMCATVRSIQRDEIKRKKKHETKQLKTGIPWHKMLNHTYYTKLIWCARTNQPREFALIMVAFNCNANIILRYHAHTHTHVSHFPLVCLFLPSPARFLAPLLYPHFSPFSPSPPSISA